MTKLPAVFAVLFLASALSLSAQDIQAVTSKGDRVMLHSNGTWTALKPGEVLKGGTFKKPASATASLKGNKVRYTMWFDAARWAEESDSTNADAEYQFVHNSGDAYAMIIPENGEMTMEDLRDAALQNARDVAPDAELIFEEERNVNGNTVRCVKINGTVENTPITYYNYYFVGKKSAIQVITFTSQSQFEEFEADMSDFLNGLEIAK
jgi:hypothetical protein